MNAELIERDESEFEDCLTELYGDVEVCGMSFESGRILRELDPIAFRCAMAGCFGRRFLVGSKILGREQEMRTKRWVNLSGGIVSESALADHSSKENLICTVNQGHPDAERNGRMLAEAPVLFKMLEDVFENEGNLIECGQRLKIETAIANVKGESHE